MRTANLNSLHGLARSPLAKSPFTFTVDNPAVEQVSLAKGTRSSVTPRNPTYYVMDYFGQRRRFPRISSGWRNCAWLSPAFSANRGLGRKTSPRWELVLAEAVANAILHGSANDPQREIEVAWSAGDGQILPRSRVTRRRAKTGAINRRTAAGSPADFRAAVCISSSNPATGWSIGRARRVSGWSWCGTSG